MDHDALRRLAESFHFAALAHEGQGRGHGRGEPFNNHVAGVARRVGRSPEADVATMLAALLHDVVEKTDRTEANVVGAFDADVAAILAELTDDEGVPEDKQRRRPVEKAPTLSPAAKRVKLADKASKMATLADAPPGWWRRGEAREELEAARAVVTGQRGADLVLEAVFDAEAARLEALL